MGEPEHAEEAPASAEATVAGVEEAVSGEAAGSDEGEADWLGGTATGGVPPVEPGLSWFCCMEAAMMPPMAAMIAKRMPPVR
jgi:hypothetical protein